MLIYRQNLLEHLHQYISNYKKMFYNNRMIDIGDYIDDALTYDDDDDDWF